MGSLPCLILQGEGSLRLQRYEEVNLRHSQLLSARAFNIGEAILALVTLWMWRDPTLLPFSLLNFANPITFRAWWKCMYGFGNLSLCRFCRARTIFRSNSGDAGLNQNPTRNSFECPHLATS